MPQWVADKQQRIAKIREAREALEMQARKAGQAAPEPKAIHGLRPFAKRGGIVTNELIDKLREDDAY